ncbi:DUF309 domain-containing protein [Synechococcus sp. PCC 7336]|uniref:DUF309 domain-containing protein n=1 Tax=Synechococcus sp. PCC 7336 TaxID=195250 RepID=UPI00034CED16|nr:DUF309 domain-containing protein [Synechococcus sp. PCC 7336]
MLEPLSAEDIAAFQTAIDQFNAREFYACHDTLEALWIEAMEPQRTFYQGILQLAVGYYHLLNGNWRGAVILLGEGLSRLERYCPDYLELDVAALANASRRNQRRLQMLGADRLSEFSTADIPKATWVEFDIQCHEP